MNQSKNIPAGLLVVSSSLNEPEKDSADDKSISSVILQNKRPHELLLSDLSLKLLSGL